MKNVEICRKPGFFYPEIQFTLINHVTVDSILLLGAVYTLGFCVLKSIFWCSICTLSLCLVKRFHIVLRVSLNPPESQLNNKKLTGMLMIYIALLTMLMYSNVCTTSALGITTRGDKTQEDRQNISNFQNTKHQPLESS
jgi:hypothetical protein